MTPRFVVTELAGYLTPKVGGGKSGEGYGLSCHVIDTLWNRRVVALFRSEDIGGVATAAAREHVRKRAAVHAAKLNERNVAA